MVKRFDYESINFPFLKNIIVELKRKTTFVSMWLVIKMIWLVLFIHQIKKIGDHMDLLLITDKKKSHYAYIKGFSIFMCNKTKSKNKKTFLKILFSLF